MVRALSTFVLVCLVACGGEQKAPKHAKAVKNDKHDAIALRDEAREHAKNNDFDAADRSYAEAYALGKNIDIIEERVDVLIHNGRVQKAQEVAKEYYDSHLTDPIGYHMYGEALLAANNGPEALKVADERLGLKDEPEAHEQRGRALLLLDRLEEGLDELRKAKDGDPKSAAFHITLGKALAKAKKMDEAALEFQAALKFASENAEVYVLLGMARREQGEYKDAKEYLDKALELDRNNGRAYFELGLLYDKQNKEGDAEMALAQAVQKSPNESLYWYAYGEVFRGQERYDDALKAYKRAVEIDPPYAKALGKYATVLIERKQYDEAEDVLNKAIRKEPRNASNYFHLGALYQAKKKNRLAAENYQRFLDLAPKSDPDYAKAKDLVVRLKR
jgi:tetratricopeptide (TPR) repeat protein